MRQAFNFNAVIPLMVAFCLVPMIVAFLLTQLSVGPVVFVAVPLSGLVVLVGGVMLLIGSAPRQATASLHLDVSAPLETVWNEIANFRKFPLYAKGGIEELPDQKGLPAWKEKAGRVGAFVVTRESAPPDRVVRESRMSASMVFWWEFRLRKDGGGTLVTLEVRTEIDGNKYSLLERLVMALVNLGWVWGTMYLKRLEAGLGRDPR